MCHHPSVSLNKEKVSREISENKIAVCEKTQGLRSGNFSNLNSACSTVLVPVKIFQFQDMHYENRFLGTFQGHSKRPNTRAQNSNFLTLWSWVSLQVRLTSPSVLLALATVSSMCLDQDMSLHTVTPRYLTYGTHSRG